MTKDFVIALILMLCSNCLYGQVDTLKSEILDHNVSNSSLISKGRELLIDKFIDGDLKKVKEIKDYLIGNEDKEYFPFYPEEHWFILYWTMEYVELAEELQKYDSLMANHYWTYFNTSHDTLYDILLEKTLISEMQIKKQIQDSPLDLETKQILQLNLERLLCYRRQNVSAENSLIEKANNFIEVYPKSKFADFTTAHIRYRLVPGNWGWTIEFYGGHNIFTGYLGENYSNIVPVGFAFGVCYKNFELDLRDYGGLNRTKKDSDYSLGTWKKGSRTKVYHPAASIGIVAYNDHSIKLSPFVGIGSMYIGPLLKVTDEEPELEEVSLELNTTYIVGLNFDIKLGSKFKTRYYHKTTYSYLRIRYGYSVPEIEKKNEGISGNIHHITIGIGGIARLLRRRYPKHHGKKYLQNG